MAINIFSKRRKQPESVQEDEIARAADLSFEEISVSDNRDGVETLSRKEYEVFQLLLHGYKLKEIAEKCERSFATINTHQNSIYKKLGVSSRAELIIKYQKYTQEVY